MPSPIQSLRDAAEALQRGETEGAAAFARARLQSDPGDAEALGVGGVAALMSDDVATALEMLSACVAARPDDVFALCGLAEAKLRMRDVDGALEAAKHAQRLRPQSLQSYAVLAPAAIFRRDEEATAMCMRAVNAMPAETAGEMVEFWVSFLSHLQSHRSAAELYGRFIAAAPPDYDRLVKQAGLLMQAEDVAAAEAVLDQAVALDEGRADAHDARVLCALQAGRIEDARDAAVALLARAPESVRASTTLADIEPSAIDETMMAHLRAQRERADWPVEQRAQAGLSLAKALEARGDVDAAFEAYASANADLHAFFARSGIGYDAARMEARLSVLKEAFSPAALAAAHAEPGAGAAYVFIAGSPRSGTTLLDQILASHSRVASVGENGGLINVVHELYGALRAGEGGGDLAAILARRGPVWTGRYREAVAGAEAQAEFVADKMLENIWCVGLIAAVFPAAKIILPRRDPLDVGLSMFRVSLPNSHAYAHDLREIGHFLTCSDAMARHWMEVLGTRVHVVDYEALLDDFEGGVERLLEYCGLQLEPACLAFQDTKRAVHTLSAAQVRRGLTTSSRGRWRRYEAHLGPLKEALGPLAASADEPVAP